jgi:hypothetical protein
MLAVLERLDSAILERLLQAASGKSTARYALVGEQRAELLAGGFREELRAG